VKVTEIYGGVSVGPRGMRPVGLVRGVEARLAAVRRPRWVARVGARLLGIVEPLDAAMTSGSQRREKQKNSAFDRRSPS
jgi:hypothetical protein